MNDFIACVTAKEMARIERLAIDSGLSELDFMERAGKGVADAMLQYACKELKKKGALLFCGMGNNGADAFVAGTYLLAEGIQVTAKLIHSSDTLSPLCALQSERFEKAGGRIQHVFQRQELPLSFDGVVIDGLVGTGFKNVAQGLLKDAIDAINSFSATVFSVDIPSGLSEKDSSATEHAVLADYTMYLELPKISFFLEGGWDHVGQLIPVSFGLPEDFIRQAQPSALLPTHSFIKGLLPKIKRSRHKYLAGYVVCFAGSPTMPGAAMLSATAALHAGAGIVRLFHQEGMDAALSSMIPEVIKQQILLSDITPLLEEMKRAGALLIGPGLGRSSDVVSALDSIIKNMHRPCVIDADALYFLSKNPSLPLPKDAVLTPHIGEMKLLLSSFDKRGEEDLFSLCKRFATEKNVVLILKGAPSFIFSPGEIPVIMPFGDPGMATAGSGDVLTGIIAAMLSEGLTPKHAAILSVYLHAKAGEMASKVKTSYCMLASDIIKFLPKAFKSLLYKAKE